MRGIFFYIPLLFFCAIFVGCQSKTVGVTGKVSFDGETGENIRVLFQPITAAAVVPEAAVGMTDRSGRFTMCLAESKKNGVLPGEYAVYISWVDPDFDANIVAEGAKPKPCPFKIPPKAKAGLITFTVPETGNCEANFEFTKNDYLEKVQTD